MLDLVEVNIYFIFVTAYGHNAACVSIRKRLFTYLKKPMDSNRLCTSAMVEAMATKLDSSISRC